MSDFNPVTLYFILAESLGAWLWALVALAVVLLAGLVGAVVRLRRTRAGAGRPLALGLGLALLASAGLTFAVPLWSQAGPGALNGPVDLAMAFALALIPGAVLGALAFMLSARARS